MVMGVLIFVLLALLGMTVLLWFRNDVVYDARMAAIDEAYRRTRRDGLGGSSKHYAALNETSYNEMLLKFWQPVSSFLIELRSEAEAES